jgi:hypothetical protein
MVIIGTETGVCIAVKNVGVKTERLKLVRD